MMSSWRRRRASKKKKAEELTIPNHFLCPKDPVTLSSGTTYDQLLPNQDWCGIDTPRIPLTSYQVNVIFAKISETNDQDTCRELVSKIKVSAKESDRNKRCLVSNGAARVLSAAFRAFSRKDDENVGVLAEILSAMIMLTPALDEEASQNLSTPPSLQKMVWFLRFGSLSTRRNAVLALKSVVSFNHDEVAKIEGALEALVKVIKEPICPTATKASLLAMYHLMESQEAIAMRLMEMGMVQMLVEMVVESERSVCEKALGVLDGMCGCKEVSKRARENALIIPVVVKKVLRVSDVATEFAVSILLKVVRSGEEESAAAEALGAGAFQKLLLVLQIGTQEPTKEKVTELLKVLNGYRSRLECVDSMDFKHLRRPF